MRKWMLVAALLTTHAQAQECEAYRLADSSLQMQFIPHLAAPPNAYVGISYNSESLVQVNSDDLSGRKVRVVKKSAGETCNCIKMITDHCRTIYVPAGEKNTFRFIDAYMRGMLFVLPEEKR
ncbi:MULTISPECIES: hypothetical protein [Lysobacter]|uniref:hypothetical protein n=1 Tax=Lysobacter TaxID=68 RepID=UPI001F1DF1C2|nr:MULTISPECIES: hypothetical protein [Lysobacter]UJB19235.1 hypothetical protein L1A79_23470 [Lysobacter capsici]UJQ27040.1 hypothetical protein L2D09_16415 [Lysobacter gummosus]